MPRQVGDVEAAYAASDRSQCKRCRRAIAKGALRIGEWYQSPTYDGLAVSWAHAACWAKRRKGKVADAAAVRGLRAMRPAVQLELCELLGIAPPDDCGGELDAARFRAVCGQLARREPLGRGAANAAAWHVRDQLAELSLAQLRALLMANAQPVTGGRQALEERVADVLLFGALPKCGACGEGDLSFSRSDDAYHCAGYGSAWAKCQLKVAGFYALQRAPVVASPNLCAFLDEWGTLRRYSAGAWLGREDEYHAAAQTLKEAKAALVAQRQLDVDGGTEAATAQAPAESEAAAPSAARPAAEAAAAALSNTELAERWRAFLLAPCADAPGVHSSEASSGQTKDRDWLGGAPKVDAERHLPGMSAQTAVRRCGDDDYFHALLNKVDIGKNSNSFYRLQLLHTRDSHPSMRWAVWSKWGRVGTSIGSHKLEHFDNLGEARDVFTQKFEEKTGNAWPDRYKFEKKAGKFSLVDDAAQTASPAAGAGSAATTNEAPSKLPEPVRDLLDLLFDPANVVLMLDAMQFDARKLPLGRLTAATVTSAFEVLTLLETVVSSPTPSAAALNALSARFYTLVPHVAPTDGASLPLLDTPAAVRAKIRTIETLRELIELQRLLEVRGSPQLATVDARYAALGCTIAALPTASPEHARIAAAIAATNEGNEQCARTPRIRVRRIFRVEREHESEHFAAACADSESQRRRLLWHGSRLTNFVGILRQGLRVAPPAAPKTGYLYGKGLYHADVFGKSAGYCAASRDMPLALVLLNEVLLGDAYELNREQYVERGDLHLLGKQSVHALGQREPTGAPEPLPGAPTDAGLASGPVRAVRAKSLTHNEFVVLDPHKVVIRYLCLFEFLFN